MLRLFKNEGCLLTPKETSLFENLEAVAPTSRRTKRWNDFMTLLVYTVDCYEIHWWFLLSAVHCRLSISGQWCVWRRVEVEGGTDRLKDVTYLHFSRMSQRRTSTKFRFLQPILIFFDVRSSTLCFNTPLRNISLTRSSLQSLRFNDC